MGSFIFVRIDLKLSVKVEKNLPRLRHYFFSMGFLETKEMTSATAKSVKVFDGLLI